MEEEKTKEYLETEIDELYELVKKNGLVKVKAAAKRFKVKGEQIEEWGRILEEHDLAILHYPPFGDPVLILKKFKPKGKVKEKKPKIKNKKALLVNIVIILVFVFFVLWYTGRLEMLALPDLSSVLADVSETGILDFVARNQIYLVLIIIIIVILVVMGVAKKKGKKRRKHVKGRGKGKGKKL
ncbi:MAG: hypothetical protein GTN38_00075 [Candidatus Aenigmarchaeota archaeon]|nr:hypothetical protein [Candidatus Aenigmarchaeota archaeon]NIP39901.1 hypothetical protein [Candidatus Aenigmarchaeota archaeon]NIQ17620.1 hypothetical protein [Candidatus Aenigmarchaeota archaeon]NIS72808.1 hypothetical protein [Candidatus Aenigmarchaeota archaeon]